MREFYEGGRKPPSTLRGDLPPKTDALIARAMHKDAERRFTRAAQMTAVVDRVLAE